MTRSRQHLLAGSSMAVSHRDAQALTLALANAGRQPFEVMTIPSDRGVTAPDDALSLMRRRAHAAVDGLFDRYPVAGLRSTMKMSEDQFRLEVVLTSPHR